MRLYGLLPQSWPGFVTTAVILTLAIIAVFATLTAPIVITIALGGYLLLIAGQRLHRRFIYGKSKRSPTQKIEE